jgi:murein L,D-transpeptidase YcbB/YkuD
MYQMNMTNHLLSRVSVISFVILIVFFTSCGEQNSEKPIVGKISKVFQSSSFSNADFAEQLKAILPAIDTNVDSSFQKKILPIDKSLNLSYQLSNYQPIWVNEDQKFPMAEALLSELDSLRFDGIDAERYGLTVLKSLSEKISKPKVELSDVITFDTLCTKAYLNASHDLLLGTVSTKLCDSQWHHTNDTVWNVYTSLANMGKTKQYTSLNDYKSKWDVYKMLVDANVHYHSLKDNTTLTSLKNELTLATKDSLIEALIHQEMPWLTVSENDSLTKTEQLIRGYQYYFGQKLTGKIDTPTLRRMKLTPDSVISHIAVNQERLRWMNQVPESTNIIVPLGLMEMFLTRDGKLGMHMRTVVGKPSRPTPSLNASMVNVVINPPWGVPPTILKNDVAPGLTKRGGAYLAKKGLKAYDRNGKVVNSSLVNGSNYKRYSYRQAPGAGNALGVIKFNLPNRWDIYLHDTPHKEDFPNRNRAKSSGCIRLQNPRDLGAYILNDMEGNANLTRNDIDTIVLTRKTQFHNLKNRIPVHIVYLTAYKDSTDSHLRLLDDIYKRDVKVASKL